MKKGRFCIKCGTKIVDGQNFCAKCGREVTQDWESIKKTVGEKIGAFFKLLPSVIGGALVLAAIVWGVLFGIRCYDMDGKTVGTWKSESVYLSAYGADIVSELTINQDGSWTRVGYVKGTTDKAFEQAGTWSISGATVVLQQPDHEGVVIHEYHLDGTLTNGNTVYTKK